MQVTFHGAAGEVTGSLHLVEAAGKRFSFEYLGVTGHPAPAPVRERLFLSDPDDLREHVTRMFHDDALLLVERRWIDATMVPDMTDASLRDTTINEWLSKNADLSQAERSVSARSAADVNADTLLGCRPDEPVLLYHTCLWIGARPFSCVRHIFVPGFPLNQFPLE